jgi:hypothetical protein
MYQQLNKLQYRYMVYYKNKKIKGSCSLNLFNVALSFREENVIYVYTKMPDRQFFFALKIIH